MVTCSAQAPLEAASRYKAYRQLANENKLPDSLYNSYGSYSKMMGIVASEYGNGKYSEKELLAAIGKPDRYCVPGKCKNEGDSVLLHELEAIERGEEAKNLSPDEFKKLAAQLNKSKNRADSALVDYSEIVELMKVKKNVSYLIYLWRGYHDFLFFVSDNGRITYCNWYFAME